jgi:hypothetical protein
MILHRQELQKRMNARLRTVCSTLNNTVCDNLEKLITRGDEILRNNRLTYQTLNGYSSAWEFDPNKPNGAIFTEEDSEEYCLQSNHRWLFPPDIALTLKFRLHAETHICVGHIEESFEEARTRIATSLGMNSDSDDDVLRWWLMTRLTHLFTTVNPGPVMDMHITLRKITLSRQFLKENNTYSKACSDIVSVLIEGKDLPQLDYSKHLLHIQALAQVPRTIIRMVCEPERMAFADVLNKQKHLISSFAILQIVNRLSLQQIENIVGLLERHAFGGLHHYNGDKRLDHLNTTDLAAIYFMLDRKVNMSTAMTLVSFFGADYLLQQSNHTLNKFVNNLNPLKLCYEDASLYIMGNTETTIYDRNADRRLTPMSDCLTENLSQTFINYLPNNGFSRLTERKGLEPSLFIPLVSMSIVLTIFIIVLANRHFNFIKPLTAFIKNSIFGYPAEEFSSPPRSTRHAKTPRSVAATPANIIIIQNDSPLSITRKTSTPRHNISPAPATTPRRLVTSAISTSPLASWRSTQFSTVKSGKNTSQARLNEIVVENVQNDLRVKQV